MHRSAWYLRPRLRGVFTAVVAASAVGVTAFAACDREVAHPNHTDQAAISSLDRSSGVSARREPTDGCTVRVAGVTYAVTQAQTQAASEVADAVRASKRPLSNAQASAMARSIEQDLGLSTASAAALAAAFSGMAPSAITCVPLYRDRALPVEPMGAKGLTPRAEAVFDAARRAHGKIGYGGFEPGGVTSGHMSHSAHYEGRAVDFFFQPMNDGNHQRAWAFANWAVANAARLDIDNVIFDAMIWSSDVGQWQPYVRSDGKDDDVSMHRDHVHVDVLPGS